MKYEQTPLCEDLQNIDMNETERCFLNMQFWHYLIIYNMLESKVFTVGNVPFSFCHSINKKLLSTAIKNYFVHVFRNELF